MKFVEIAGANLTLAEDQDEYETIKVRRAAQALHYPDGSVAMVPGLTVELKPSPEDIQTLREGGSLFVNILGNQRPPISVTTYDPTRIDATEGNA